MREDVRTIGGLATPRSNTRRKSDLQPLSHSPGSKGASHHSKCTEVMPLVGKLCSTSRVSNPGPRHCGAPVAIRPEQIQPPTASSPSRRRVRRLRGHAATDPQVHNAQQWLDLRLLGLSALSFHSHGIAVYTMQKLDRPPAFECPFFNFGPRHRSSEMPEDEQAQILPMAALLVFGDVGDATELQDAIALCECIDSLDAAPPVILVPHSAKGASQLAHRGEDEVFALLSGARDAGFDAVVNGEPQGFGLALAVSSELRQQTKRCEFISNEVEERRKMARRARAIQAATDSAVWDFLRSNIAMNTVPPMDPDIARCEPGALIYGFTVGHVLGEGSFGKVFALTDTVHSTPVGKVLKALAKKRMTDFQGISKLNNQLEVLRFLTEYWKHENVVQLHAVFHSETHVLIQMQDAGPLDLYKRLRQRAPKNEDEPRSLCPTKAASAISQCLKAVCHLHTGPRVVHRDIKPENLIVFETDDDIHISLADFDLACVMSEDAQCKGMVGSFPFMAPEMVLRKRYGPFAADIWSVGVVCLEVLCGISILKYALSLPSASNVETRRKVSQVIVDFFDLEDSVGEFLKECMMPELEELFESTHALISGMLTVDALERWNAQRIIDELGSSRESSKD